MFLYFKIRCYKIVFFKSLFKIYLDKLDILVFFFLGILKNFKESSMGFDDYMIKNLN